MAGATKDDPNAQPPGEATNEPNPNDVTEAHVAAYEQTANDPALARILRHFAEEIGKLRGDRGSRGGD